MKEYLDNGKYTVDGIRGYTYSSDPDIKCCMYIKKSGKWRYIAGAEELRDAQRMINNPEEFDRYKRSWYVITRIALGLILLSIAISLLLS